MVWLGGIIVVLGFVVLLKLFGLIERSKRVISIAKSSVTVMQDKQMDDLGKEKAMQKNATDLLVLFLIITVLSALAVGLPFVLVWVMELAGLVTVNQVIELTLSWEFILVAIVLSVAYFWIIRKKPEKTS